VGAVLCCGWRTELPGPVLYEGTLLHTLCSGFTLVSHMLSYIILQL